MYFIHDRNIKYLTRISLYVIGLGSTYLNPIIIIIFIIIKLIDTIMKNHLKEFFKRIIQINLFYTIVTTFIISVYNLKSFSSLCALLTITF